MPCKLLKMKCKCEWLRIAAPSERSWDMYKERSVKEVDRHHIVVRKLKNILLRPLCSVDVREHYMSQMVRHIIGLWDGEFSYQNIAAYSRHNAMKMIYKWGRNRLRRTKRVETLETGLIKTSSSSGHLTHKTITHHMRCFSKQDVSGPPIVEHPWSTGYAF